MLQIQSVDWGFRSALSRKRFLVLGVIALTAVPLAGQRPMSRPDRADQGSGYAAGRADLRSSTPRPGGGACPGGAHDGNHASNATTSLDEHVLQFCGMFPKTDATHTAAMSGPWSDPRTWNGRLPGNDAKVLIPAGVTVTLDREFATPLFWLRVDGTLRFSAEANTSLIADTVKIEDSGRLEIGTAAKPIPAGTTARIIIKARGGHPIDHSWDPIELSRGVIVHGIVEIHGAAKTPFVSVSAMPRAGSATVVTDAAPTGWVSGDSVVLTATEYDQDETFKLVRIEGRTITLDRPLRNQRTLPNFEDAPGWPKPALHLANFTRNVEIRTDPAYAGDSKLQGHLMLMHRAGQKMSWVGLYDLGRTTIKPVTDPSMRDGSRNAGVNPAAGLSAENIRGRYALHFHGAGPGRENSEVEGCAIEVRRGAGFKIGVANHSSNVRVRGCVSHNIDGSHFFTEEGDEIGEFKGNLAIHSVGSGTDRDEQPRDVVLKADPALHQRRRLDTGHRGTGFWLNGGGVDVIDNVSAGQAHSGFHLWTRPLNFRITGTYAVRFPVANLRNGSWASSTDNLGIDVVPIRFIGNTAYVLAHLKNRGEGGFLFELHGIAARSRFPNAPYSELFNLLSWNAGGIRTQYTGNLHLKNVRIIGGFHRADDVGARLGAQGGNSDIIENLRVEGFPRGVTLPTRSTIKGGFFATGVGIPVGVNHDVTIDLTDMKFAPTDVPVNATVRSTAIRPTSRDAAQLSSGMKYDLHVQPIIMSGDLNASAFAPRPPTKVNGHPKFPNGAQLYSLEQMPDYVLPDFGVPGILDGKTTTREAWEKYRLAPGGVIAPPGTAPLEGLRSNGVFGPPVQVEVSASPRAGRALAQGRLPLQDRSAVRGQGGQSTNASRPTREEMAAIRDARAAARAARRGTQDSAGQPAAEPSASPREPRRADRQGQQSAGVPPRDQAGTREARRDPDNSQISAVERSRQPRMRPGSTDGNAGPAWELVPKSGGGMLLVPTGNRPRIPGVTAGLDQTVSLSEGVALQGSAAADTSVQWSKAYGPGSVTFDDAGRTQTRARFSTRGTYVLHLTVADQAGQKNTASVTVIVL